MPRVKIGGTAQTKREDDLRYTIEDFMNRNNVSNSTMAKIIGCTEATFISKRKHRTGEFTISDIWKMEKYFGCSMTQPLRKGI